MENTNKTPFFIEMLPNSSVEIHKRSDAIVKLHSQIFADIEVSIKDNVININICGKPKVKRIIYG